MVYPAVHTYIQLFVYKYLTDNGVYYRPAQVLGLLVYMICVYCMVRIAQLAFKDAPAKANIVLIHCFTFTSMSITVEKLFNDSILTMF